MHGFNGRPERWPDFGRAETSSACTPVPPWAGVSSRVVVSRKRSMDHQAIGTNPSTAIVGSTRAAIDTPPRC
jgi:hypothetical protein